MEHVEDYTGRRKGSRTEHGIIAVCPKCGRKGAERKYIGGGDMVVHKRVLRMPEGPLPHWEITDSCFLPAAQGEGGE